jgi:phosphoglycerate dehydrogenase-like enzyme
MAFFGAVKEAPNCRWMQISWIGMDFPIFKELIDKPGFAITNAAGTNAAPIATSTMAALLSLNRGFPYWMAAQHKREWANRERLPIRRDVAGQTVLIFGFGAIGRKIGRMCKAFDLHVIAMQRSAPSPDVLAFADEVAQPEELGERIGDADFCIIACPLTDATRGIFSSLVLSRMKSTAFLLNVGRGAVVDEGALLDALQQEKIAGAYIDGE